MEQEILDLEKLLEQEIEACSKLEKYIIEKKDHLVKGNLEEIRKTDIELEKYNSAVEKLEQKRQELYPDKSTLSEIIATVKEKNRAQYLTEMKHKLGALIKNAQKQNNINAELIKHSLKIIDGSINSIINVLVPENTHYNSRGKAVGENSETISSIVHEA